MRDTASVGELSIRLPEHLRDDVIHLAKTVGQTPDWMIERAVLSYLAGEGADLLSAAKGDAEFAAGGSEDFDDILSDLESIVHGKAA